MTIRIKNIYTIAKAKFWIFVCSLIITYVLFKFTSLQEINSIIIVVLLYFTIFSLFIKLFRNFYTEKVELNKENELLLLLNTDYLLMYKYFQDRIKSSGNKLIVDKKTVYDIDLQTVKEILNSNLNYQVINNPDAYV